MKKQILTIAVFTVCLATGFSQTLETTATPMMQGEELSISSRFGVNGNCGMCKKKIEKAAKSVVGVSSAVWDVEKKNIDVIFVQSKTTGMSIHNAIAAAGYDTEKVRGNDDAYNNLPGCCKYDRSTEYNREVKTEDHSGHNH